MTLENVHIRSTGASPLLHAIELEAEAGGGLAIILAADAAAARSEGLVAKVRNAIDSVGDTLARPTNDSSDAENSSVPAPTDGERFAYRRGGAGRDDGKPVALVGPYRQRPDRAC